MVVVCVVGAMSVVAEGKVRKKKGKNKRWMTDLVQGSDSPAGFAK